MTSIPSSPSIFSKRKRDDDDDMTNDVDARESKEIKPDSPPAIVVIEILESGSQIYFVRRSGIVSSEETIILDKIENGPTLEERISAMRVIGLCVDPCSMRDLKQVEDLFFSLNGTSRMSFDVKNIAEWEMIETEKDVTTLTREKHCIIYIHDPWT